MPDEQAPDEKSPYISFATLMNFLDRLGAGPIPPRIDKSALDTYSGGTQAILMVTLRTMDLIDSNGAVKPALREVATSPDGRKAYFEAFTRQFYAEQLSLAAQNATAQMLLESFQRHGFQGSTLRKAIVFYLALVEYTGLPTSPHFKPPKQPATGARSRSRPRPGAKPTPGVVRSQPLSALTAPGAETRTIYIGDSARITLTVQAQWLDLPIDVLTSLRQVIADLEALGTGADTEETDEAENPEGDPLEAS